MKKSLLLLLLMMTFSSSPTFAEKPSLSENWDVKTALKTFDKNMTKLREQPAHGRFVKIRDLIDISGEESIKLNGFGIVSGLQKTGDSSAAAKKMIIKIAKDQGIYIDEGDISGNNLALVSISAEVSPHQRKFDLAVKSIGDAKSLQNGFLEASTLSPIGNAEIYAVVSGSVALGSRHFEAAGSENSLSSVTIGHPTMGFIIQGGELIKEIPTHRLHDGKLTFFLKHPSNRTATNIANTINEHTKPLNIYAEPKNASTIAISIPEYFQKQQGRITRLLADLGDLPSKVSRKAMITVDQGSGIIAMTNDVKMEPGSLTIGGLTVTVTSNLQPIVSNSDINPVDTKIINEPELDINQQQGNVMTLPAGTDLRIVQQTFNAMKISPETMMSVFTALHQAGMIHADIIVMPR